MSPVSQLLNNRMTSSRLQPVLVLSTCARNCEINASGVFWWSGTMLLIDVSLLSHLISVLHYW